MAQKSWYRAGKSLRKVKKVSAEPEKLAIGPVKVGAELETSRRLGKVGAKLGKVAFTPEQDAAELVSCCGAGKYRRQIVEAGIFGTATSWKKLLLAQISWCRMGYSRH